jgi:phospholipid/cholesterol/gamma-HCH transport system substrate-binding protein
MKIAKEIKIALVAIVGLVVLFFGMNYLKGLHLFSSDSRYFMSFKDISGLSEAAPIYADGYRVGVVENIIFDYQGQKQIVAVIGLDKQMRLPKGSSATISKDLMGNIQLDLELGPNPTDLMAPGDTLRGAEQQGLMGKAGAMLPKIEQMLPKLDSILASVNALLADPALASSLHNIDHITANLTTTTDQLHRLSASLNTQVPGMLQKADVVLDNTSTLTKNLSDLDIAMTMAKVNNTLQNVEQMTAKLNSNEGTIGLLMRDQELYSNVTSTMGHVDSLMIDLKQHPQRYVHFSLFGRKNK